VSSFHPRLDILASAQKELWPRLDFTRKAFVLYGGTALALRLGHRVSQDFDFFSFAPLDPRALQSSTPLLHRAEILQWEQNTLTLLIAMPSGSVKLSFFGGLTFSRVREPDQTDDGVLAVASLPDLFATKLNAIYQRAEAKDYLDIHALLQSGLRLAEGLQFARQVYGDHFNSMLPLEALCYFKEPGLALLPERIRTDLIKAVKSL